MLNWPWKRFEKFYEAFAKRQIAEELTQRKLLVISAFYANTNYDSKEANREDTISKIEKQFSALIDSIYAPVIHIGKTKTDEPSEMDSDFFKAIRVEGDHLMES